MDSITQELVTKKKKKNSPGEKEQSYSQTTPILPIQGGRQAGREAGGRKNPVALMAELALIYLIL